MTQGHCPTPLTSPILHSHECDGSTCKNPSSENLGNPPGQNKNTPWMVCTCLKKQPTRVAFRNNDIYMVNGEESDPYKEPQERNVRVFYKLKVNKDPALKIHAP